MYLLGLDSNTFKIEEHFDRIMNDLPEQQINDSKSLIWARTFGITNHNKDIEKKLEKKLKVILDTYNKKNNNTTINNKATHIAIGHTPQIKDGINSLCNGTIWRCDIGMSKAFMQNDNHINDNRRLIQVLEIVNNKPVILTEK
jgi:hypothetical protein